MTSERTKLTHAGFDFYAFTTPAARAEFRAFRAGHAGTEFVELEETVEVGKHIFPLYFLGERTLRGKAAAQAALEEA